MESKLTLWRKNMCKNLETYLIISSSNIYYNFHHSILVKCFSVETIQFFNLIFSGENTDRVYLPSYILLFVYFQINAVHTSLLTCGYEQIFTDT